MKFFVFLFLGMGVYGLLAESYAGAMVSFAMAGFVRYADRKMVQEEVKGDTGSDRDSLS
jgi:hypothetical protein